MIQSQIGRNFVQFNCLVNLNWPLEWMCLGCGRRWLVHFDAVLMLLTCASWVQMCSESEIVVGWLCIGERARRLSEWTKCRLIFLSLHAIFVLNATFCFKTFGHLKGPWWTCDATLATEKGQLPISKWQLALSRPSSMGMPITSGCLPVMRLADVAWWLTKCEESFDFSLFCVALLGIPHAGFPCCVSFDLFTAVKLLQMLMLPQTPTLLLFCGSNVKIQSSWMACQHWVSCQIFCQWWSLCLWGWWICCWGQRLSAWCLETASRSPCCQKVDLKTIPVQWWRMSIFQLPNALQPNICERRELEEWSRAAHHWSLLQLRAQTATEWKKVCDLFNWSSIDLSC